VAIDRDVTVDFNADVSSYTASTTQAIALTKEYTAELTGLAGAVAKVGNAFSTGMVDTMSRLVRAQELGVSSAAAYQQQLSSLEGAVSVTGGNFGKLERQVKSLAREIPIGIGGAVRQFEALQKVGIPTERVAGMAKAFSQLEGATGESGIALAQMGVQLSRVFNNQSLRGVQGLNDALVTTSRTFGASASGVMSFANAIAPMAKSAGLAQTEVLGISTAFSRMSEDGYRAANALTKMMTDIDRSVREGGSEMTIYANTVGKTNEEFRKLYDSNPAEAYVQIFEALNKMGPDAVRQLEAMGLEGVRTQKSIQTVVQSGDLRDTIKTAVDSYGSGSTAATAEKAFGGLNDQMTMLSESMSQTVSTAGKPFIEFLEGVARVATDVSETFLKVADSPLFQQMIKVGGGLAALGTVAGGFGTVASVLGVGKGLMGGTGAAGRGTASFLDNNRGKLLGAGALGLLASGMGGGGVGLLLPMLAAGFIGPERMRNVSTRLGEALYTNTGQWAGMTLSDIAEGRDIRRTRESRAYRAGQDLLKQGGATWRERAGLLSVYSASGRTAFTSSMETILEQLAEGTIDEDEARRRIIGMDAKADQGSRWSQGGRAAARMAVYGGGGAIKGIAGLGLAAVGGLPGLAAGGTIVAGAAAYNAYEEQKARRAAVDERIKADDTTSALNDLRTALGVATVATHDFGDAISNALSVDVEHALNTTRAGALTVTEGERIAAQGESATLPWKGGAGEQARLAEALMGPQADVEYITALMADLAAANTGNASRTSAVSQMLRNQPVGQGAAVGYTIGAMDQGWATAVQGLTSGQASLVDQMADATSQGFQDAFNTGGLTGMVEQQTAVVQGLAAEMNKVGQRRATQQGESANYDRTLGNRQREAYESFLKQTLGLTQQESREFGKIAVQESAAAAEEYYRTRTGAGQEAQDALERGTKDSASALEKLFDTETKTFDAMLPALKDLAETNLGVQDYLDKNSQYLSVSSRAVMEALANPGNLGMQIEAGKVMSTMLLASPAGSTAAITEFNRARATQGVGTPNRVIMDQAAAQAERDLQRRRGSMSSVQARRDIMAVGQATYEDVMANGPTGDAQIDAENEQKMQASKDAADAEKQFMIERMNALREYNIQRARTVEQFELQMGRQEDAFYRQRGYAQASFRRQQEYAEADFYRNRQRAQDDFALSVSRAQEDYRVSQARSWQDYYIGLQREAQDHEKAMVRIAEDTAARFMDPFTRVGPAQTFSTGGLLRNLERQAKLAQEQLQTLDRLREAGLSQSAIDTMRLADPNQARQVSRMAGMSAQEIAELNAAADQRQAIGAGYRDEDRDIRRQEEDRQQSLARQAEDFAKSLARADEDFAKSLARNADDFNRSMARSSEDFFIQTTRAQNEFNISMAQQLTEFNISMAQAREDHNTQLRYMAEDLQRSGEEIHGTYQEIAQAYMEMVSGDAEAYKQVTSDTTSQMRSILATQLGNIPGDLATALGPSAWMFGLGEVDLARQQRYIEVFARALRAGLTSAGAAAAAENALKYGPGGVPRGGGGEYGEDGFSAGGELFPGNHRVSTYSGHGRNAWDVGTPQGTPIYAPFDGTLVNKLAGGGWSSYGQYLEFSGSGGRKVLIAHLSRYGTPGSKRTGQLIGYTGGQPGVYGSGRSTGPHAHVEAYVNGVSVPPTNIVKYDTGGVLHHGTTAINLSGKPEAIINNEQWTALRRLGEELGALSAGISSDPRGMGIVGEVIGRHLDAWEAKVARVSGYAATAGPSSSVQTFDSSTKVLGPVQVVSNDPLDMGRKIAARARRARAYQPVGSRR